MAYELYLITNNITQKSYVGQTKSEIGYLRRFQQHCQMAEWDTSRQKSLLHKSIHKYGAENFSIKLLMHGLDESAIDFYESLWIQKLNTFYKNGHGYNMTLGGQGIHGYKHSGETRQKMSLKNKGRNISSKTIQKRLQAQQQNNSMMKRRLSPTWRQHLSNAAKKRFETSPGTFTGKHHSEETKAKLSALHSKPIICFDLNTGRILREYPSATEAAKDLISEGRTSNKSAFTRILKICKGQDKSAYGYGWRFVDCRCND